MTSQAAIAEQLNVSQATVSRCLTQPNRVAPAMRRRVLAAMQQSNYEPNEIANYLKRRRINMVAVSLPALRESFFPAIVEGIEAAVRARDWQVMIGSFENQPDIEADQLALARRLRAGGMIVAPRTWHRELYQRFIDSNTPLVTVDSRLEDDTFPHVGTDEHHGGRIAAEHLLELGHRRIAVMHGTFDLSTYADRFRGFADTLNAAGCPLTPDLIREGGPYPPDGRRAFERLWAIPAEQRPTAVFCDNDGCATGVMQAALEAGVRVPEQLSIVGYAGFDWTAYLAVPLTTVKQPALGIGERAGEMIFEIIERGRPERAINLLKPDLIVRKSTAAVPAVGS